MSSGRWIRTAACLGLATLVAFPVAQADGGDDDQAPFSRIIVFGDSLSDTGNSSIVLGAPPSPPYFDGRFSNGPVWVERIPDQFGLPALLPSTIGGTNFAWGGAETGAGFSTCCGVPNLGTQIEFFFGGGNTLDGDELIAVWGGGNDALQFLFTGGLAGNDPATAAENIADHVAILALAGGEVFLVGNLPQLGHTPLVRGTPLEEAADDWAIMFGNALEMELDDLKETLGIIILQFDAAEVFEEILDDPEEFGLTNVTDPACPPCAGLPGDIVPNPENYLLWDNVHVTAVIQEILGDVAAQIVEEFVEDEDDDGDDHDDGDDDDEHGEGATALAALFQRGDSNDDGCVDISDPIDTLGFLFLGGVAPTCADAADSNDDGAVDISDVINTLGVLFLGRGVIPVPGMSGCGVDPTEDDVRCQTPPMSCQ